MTHSWWLIIIFSLVNAFGATGSPDQDLSVFRNQENEQKSQSSPLGDSGNLSDPE